MIQLDVSAPFHCRLMAPAAEALAKALSSIVIRAPLVPVLSNVTGKPHGSPEQIRAALVEQVTAAVRWHECVLHAREAFQCEEQIEFGPGEVLTSLAKKLKPPLVARYCAMHVECFFVFFLLKLISQVIVRSRAHENSDSLIYFRERYKMVARGGCMN